MSRPRKNKNDKKSIRFTFRMTEEEFRMLAVMAEFYNTSGGEVIRACVFKPRSLKPVKPLLDRQTYGELKRIGNNINQIARHLNTGMKADAGEIKKIKEDMNRLINQILHDR
jgi:hypothetical protein